MRTPPRKSAAARAPCQEQFSMNHLSPHAKAQMKKSSRHSTHITIALATNMNDTRRRSGDFITDKTKSPSVSHNTTMKHAATNNAFVACTHKLNAAAPAHNGHAVS